MDKVEVTEADREAMRSVQTDLLLAGVQGNGSEGWRKAEEAFARHRITTEAATRAKVEGEIVAKWMPIESAPKDGTEILAYREDSGVFLVRWSSAAEFLTDAELDEWDEESAHQQDWFCADFIAGCRLENDLLPTHWQPLPAPPTQGTYK